jgi:hypothetical protein
VIELLEIDPMRAHVVFPQPDGNITFPSRLFARTQTVPEMPKGSVASEEPQVLYRQEELGLDGVSPYQSRCR